jgi:nucleoside-diphosphate-sugar epimerase
MKALVVGGTGLLGEAVCRALAARGADVLAVSRRGIARDGAGRGVAGDVGVANLGLPAAVLGEVRASVTHIVSCFGSVDWEAGPREAIEVHRQGTERVLKLAAGCTALERLVHVSSLLALGEAAGPVTNRELYVGQRFRNWYEYGKYLAERAVRDERNVPVRIVRFGPITGPCAPHLLSTRHGILAVLPALLRGYPVHLERGGDFPCYIGDPAGAAQVVAGALTAPPAGAGPEAWSWFDPDLPSLAEVLTELCAPWNVVPRIVSSKAVGVIARALATRVGLPRQLLDYTHPWFDLPAGVLGDLPFPAPRCAEGYLYATGATIRDAGRTVTGVY